MILDPLIDVIKTLVASNKSYYEIHTYLVQNYSNLRGLSERSIRRFIKKNKLKYKPNDEELIVEVSNTITQLGSYYGRRMTTGALRSQGVFACESRVRQAMLRADPVNYVARQTDSNRRFNPVPYNSMYFGHKIHIDLNEKLVFFNCVIVGAIDGYVLTL